MRLRVSAGILVFACAAFVSSQTDPHASHGAATPDRTNNA